MSKRLRVLLALKSLVAAALPGADVRGLDNGAAKPDRIAPGGRVVVRAGDPGQPEVDLSPPTYHFAHRIPLELAGYPSATQTADAVVDTMLGRIGVAIAADRTLGGLCDHLEALAPGTDDIGADGTAVAGGADLVIVAHYATTDPLN
jgi:hypothetical protein